MIKWYNNNNNINIFYPCDLTSDQSTKLLKQRDCAGSCLETIFRKTHPVDVVYTFVRENTAA